MPDNLPLKKLLLRTLIGALVISALIGIYAFLFGEFNETEVKILLTTLSVSYFSVTSLACAAALEKGKQRFLSIPGLLLGVVGFVMFLLGIWAEWFDSEGYAKSMIVVGIFSFSLAQACLLSLPELAAKFRWVYYGAIGSIFALALLISGMVIFEADDEWLFRIAGVLGILDGCATVTIPVLYKLGDNEHQGSASQRFSEITLICPQCGRQLTSALGEIICPDCSLKVRIEIEQTEIPRGAAV